MKLSVITSIYNGEIYIENMMQSILNQTFQDFEWIIVDDGSTDETWEILNDFKDERIKLFKLATNMGVGYANQFALNHVKGKYIAKVDVDDISLTTRFEKQVNFLEAHPEIDVVDSYIDYFTDNPLVKKSERYKGLKNYYEKQLNQPLSSMEISEQLYWHCIVVHGAMMARAYQIKQFGYSPKMKIGEDYLLFYNMNKSGNIFFKMPEKLLKVRVSNYSTTAIHKELNYRSVMEIKKNELDIFLNRSSKPLAIWGTGSLGEWTYNYLNKYYQIRPEVFIDIDITKNGKKLCGINICSPNKIDITNYKIIIASSSGKYQIVSLLKEEGFEHLKDYFVIL